MQGQLCISRSFLILDEPVNGLDPVGIKEMREFGKQSVTVTIVAAVIISVVICQIMAMTLNYFVGAVIFLAVGSIGAVIAWNNLKTNIANMEV